MKGRRFTLLALAAAAALGAAAPAHAMPPLLAAAAVAIGTTITGLTATAFLASTAFLGLSWGAVLFTGTLVYGAYQAHQARADARRAYNRSLQDRNITLYGGEVPWQVIYGEAVVKPAVAAVLTSGARDEFKHVVTVWANHECEACLDVMIAGESVGPLDANGWATTGKWSKTETTTQSTTVTLNGSAQATLPHVPLQVFEAAFSFGGDSGFDFAVPTWTPGSAVITVPGWEGRTVTVSYTRATSNARVRVRHFLGSPDQTADPVLMALLPAEWTASDRGRGLTYSVWTFDLREPELQGGMPDVSARWKGKKLYDPRTGTTAWSANNALAVRDFLLAEYGKRCAAAQINEASFMAAANDCDEALPEADDAPRYTCNGAFRTDQDPDVTLRELLQSMAGSATFAGTWRVQAGVYTAPVMDLGDADNAGAVESIPSPTGLEIFNGLRGQFYDPDKGDQLTDYPPYSNAAFVAEDGAALWGELSLPFTNEAWRCHNIARIFTERSRAEQITYPAKLKALRLRPGQRVRLSNSFLDFTNAVFRVVKKDWAPGSPAVNLLLQQDDASWWDTVDAPATTPPPADNNPDPWAVAAPAGVLVESGNGTVLISADRTVLSRVRVTLTASSDTLVREGGALQIEYRLPEDAEWTGAPEAPGSTTQVFLQGLQDDRQYLVRLRWRNGLGAVSDWVVRSVVVRADLIAPAEPEGLGAEAVPAGLRVYWDPPAEQDYLESELKVGTSFATAVRVWVGAGTEHTWVPPADGPYTLWLRHRDTSLNDGDPASLEVDYEAVGGASGGSSAQVFLYQRTGSSSAPALPAVDLTYTFSTGLLSGGSLGGWSQTLPAASGGAYLHATSAPAYSTTDEALILATAWAPAQVLARDGADGDGVFVTDPGFEGAGGVWSLSNGGSIVSGSAWEGSKFLQVAWAGGGTTIHATNRYFPAVAGASYRLGAAVKQGSPAGNGTLFVRIAWRDAAGALVGSTAASATAAAAWTALTATGTVPAGAVQGRAEVLTTGMTSGVWQVDGIAVEPQGAAGADGAAGSPGTPGTSVAELSVYRRASSAPAAPSGGSFNFGTQVLTPPAGWSIGVPSGTDPVYGARGIASTATPGGTATPSWSAAALAFTDGQAVDAIFRRSATQPATPAASAGVPAGWYSNVADVPAGSDPLWSSFGRRSAPGASWIWQVPVRVQGVDGPPGDPGTPGVQAAVAYLYQWFAAGATPPNPSGSSTWTWASGAHGSYTGGNGWSTSVPANPGTPGLALWVCSKAVTATAGTASSSVSWTSGYEKYALSGNGAAGTPGVQVATPTLWRWATSIPTISGSNGYTWASGAITGTLPSGWSTTPGTGSPGQTLWGAAVQLLGAAGDTTGSIDWTGASITARGYAGADGSAGSPGPAGISARRAYAVTTTSLGGGTVVSTGINSLPANGSFGAATWTASPGAYGVGEQLWQSDGLYNPATNQITWEAPYLSALKVGQLAALAVNTGALTVNGVLTLAASGAVQSGKTSYADTTAGFYLGFDGGAHRFSIGNATASMSWSGSALGIKGATLTGGDFTSYAWPAVAGQSGFALDPQGLRLGNPTGGGQFFSVKANGDVESRQFTIIGGTATFSGALSAVTGTFGALTVATGGNIKSGQTAYNTGTGFWLGLDGGTPKFSIGAAAGNRVTWDGSTLTVQGATINSPVITSPVLPTLTASISATSNVGVGGNGTSRSGTASITSVSGGRSPYSYAWSLSNLERYGSQSGFDISGASSATIAISATGTNAIVMADLVCVITDANGQSITKTTSLTVQWGTPVLP